MLKNYSDNKDTDDVETGSYDEVSTSYAELNRNTGDETRDDKTYQELLKNDSDYVIPAEDHVESAYEETSLTKSSPGYTELDKTTREPEDYVIPAEDHVESPYEETNQTKSPPGYTELDKTTQEPEDYVIPAEDHVESPYEETSQTKSLPGYTELDKTTREPEDDASYQKLIKQ